MRTDLQYRQAMVRNHWWRWALSSAMIAVLALGIVLLLPVRPHTHREAIAMLLERHDQPAREIVVGELQRPHSGNCLLHDCRDRVASVIVFQEQQFYGRMVCHDGEGACVFSLPALNIYNEPLADMAGVSRYPRTFEELVLVVRAKLRSTIARLYGGRG